MPTRKVMVTNSIIACLLLVLSWFALNLNLSQTYLTVTAPLSNGQRDSNQIALMIIVDETTWVANVSQIVETLTSADAQATFFFTGATAVKDLNLLQKIATSYELGNCGFTNTPLNLADKNQITESIMMSDTLIASLTKRQMHLFTPPAGLYNRNTIAMASNLGYTTVLPTARDTVIDWQTADPNIVLSYATYNVQGGDIILLKPTTATMQAFARILTYYVSHQYEIIALGQLLGLSA